MSKKKTTIIVLVTVAAGLISFFSARMSALSELHQAESSQKWLENVPPAIAESEASFDEEIAGLLSNLNNPQTELLTVLEDPNASNENILEHVDSVNKAHEYLIRQVGQHIVELRHELGAANREKLMQLCAEAVSEPMRRLGARMNGQAGNQGQGGRGYRYGQSNRGGRGYGYRRGAGQAGQGYGQQFRFWNRMANRLSLTPEQVVTLQENDPNFESDSIELNDRLSAERQKLLSLFENPQSTDSELLQQIDNLIKAHSTAERKIAEHVLALRPYLTIDQQKWLIGLCRGFQTGE